MKQKLLFLLVLLLTATTGAMAQDYYAPSTDEVIILNDVYEDDLEESGFSSHSAIAWGGSASTSNKKAGDPNKGGQPTSSTVSCYTVKGTGQGKNITLSITGVSKVIVYYHGEPVRYIELRDGSKTGNIIGSGEKNTYYTEVDLTATNKYSIFLHGTTNGSDDADFYVYAIKLIAAPAPATTYSVTLAEGTEDADKWSVKAGEGEAQKLPLEGLEGGEKITVTYGGERKVKSVKAVKKASGTDLATITADYEAKDGETLTGTLASNVLISIAAGATVTLKDVNITNLGNNCDWAGINCPGDATLVLAGTNTVCAGRDDSGYNNYPGIYIASGKTLTIQGEGTLTAYSNGTNPYAAGIGGGCDIISCGNIVINSGTITATGGWGAAGIGGGEGAGCGNITINGGTVTATGGQYGAGIGSGGDGENYGSCGNITISGGTVEATGGENAAGIGGGRYNGACGTITITSGVTSVKATKGTNAPNSIGKGDNGQDITVNIENGANVTQK